MINPPKRTRNNLRGRWIRMSMQHTHVNAPALKKRGLISALTLKQVKANWLLYLFLLPALVYILVFHYAPIYGIQIAFKDFDPVLGITGSPWVGMKYFTRFFASPRFSTILTNTITLSVYGLVAGFPAPIILALMLNYTPNVRLRRFAQTVTYAPHFISTVVVVGMLSAFMSPTSGFINTLIKMMGGEPVYFFGKAEYFQHIYVWSDIWQSCGWGSIIYLAALTSVSPELHESAIIDGANKLQRILHIDLPTILPTTVIMLILSAGNIMNVGFEKTYLLQNSLNLTTSEVISTYTYKVGLLQAQYEYSTAIGLFNNVVNFAMVLLMNKVSKLVSGNSLW